MESYEVIPDVYRIPGGMGSNGENFGGILIRDDPTIIVGASGGSKYSEHVIEILSSLHLKNEIRFYLPNVTVNELITMEHLIKEMDKENYSFNFYVHQNLAQDLSNIKDNYLSTRYSASKQNELRSFNRNLPKSFGNIKYITKMSSFTTQKTKILVIPFNDVHKGHTFIYSRDHKLLCTGLTLGYSPSNPRSYYVDLSGSYENYKKALNFISQAQSDLIAPAYDVPQFTKSIKGNIYEIEANLEQDNNTILELVTSNGKSLEEVFRDFKLNRGFDLSRKPFDILPLGLTVVEFHLNYLKRQSKISYADGKYRRT